MNYFISLVSALLLVAGTAQAQLFKPLRQGLTYQFGLNPAADSIYSLRIRQVTIDTNGDSVFWLNKVWREAPFSWQPANSCINGSFWQARVRPDNVFGERMVQRPNGEYLFITSVSDTFRILTQAPIGTSWTFTSNGPVTITYLSSSVQTIYGSITDQVQTFQLSTGQLIKLSSTYGFVEAPAFRPLIYPTLFPRSFTFQAIPEAGLGDEISNPLKIYDFQPGDKFRKLFTSTTCLKKWMIDSVAARTDYPAGDSIRYTIVHYGVGNINACNVFTSYGPTSYDLVVYRHPMSTDPNDFASQRAQKLSSLGQEYTTIVNSRNWLQDSILRSDYHNRYKISFHSASTFDSCAQAFKGDIDNGTYEQFGVGLGSVYDFTYGMFHTTETVLEAYVKGTETYGTWRTVGSLLNAPESLAQNRLQLAPNPFTDVLTLRSVPGPDAEVTVYNLLGQPVYRSRFPGGQELRLSLGHLPAGLYQVELCQGAARTMGKTLKLE